MAISFYDERGEFKSSLTGDVAVIELTKELTEDPWVDGDWFGKPFYVLDGDVLPRPENPTTVSGLALENVPIPATVIVNGVSYQTDDSFIEFDFNQPGTYAVKVIAWPYLDKEFSIENPA